MFTFMHTPSQRRTRSAVLSPRRWLRAAAAFLVAVLLGTQLAVAAYACPLQMAGLVDAGKVDAGAASAATSACDQMDMAMPNLCAEHCKYGQQIDQAQAAQLPQTMLAAMYILPPPPDVAAPPCSAAASPGALASAFPPHAILHCVLRI